MVASREEWLPNDRDEKVLIFRYFDLVRDVRQNKGSILKASVDYIKKLKVDQDRKKFLEQKCRIQEYQTRKLIAKLQVRYVTPLIIYILSGWGIYLYVECRPRIYLNKGLLRLPDWRQGPK